MASARSKKRVLFVCSHNKVRSATAEQVYRARPDLEVRSAGIAEHASVPLTQELFEWADLVFVFSKRQQKVVQARFRDSSGRKNVVCLNLPDVFQYKSSDLIMRLTGKLGPYLGPPNVDEWAPNRAAGAASATPPAAENPTTLAEPPPGSLGRKMLSLFESVVTGSKPVATKL